MHLKFESFLPTFQLIIAFACCLAPFVKSSEVVLNEYGTVFDVLDVDKKNLFNIEWPGPKTEAGSSSDDMELV